MNTFAKLDRQYLWHPFTQMREWIRSEPIVIVRGRGSVLVDARGREYLDANSSIWTNLHGHNHPQLNAALKEQLGKIAHSSALGLANEPASLLGKQLINSARLAKGASSGFKNPKLTKVFYSDDGSTAMEAGLKMAYEFVRRTGLARRPRLLSLAGGYHGDTVGAVSLGHIDLFHKTWRGLLFKTDQVMAPYCYRCPFNRAKPERADARAYRQCNWECVDKVENVCARQRRRGEPYAAFIFEPRMQGAAGLIAQPDGWLRKVGEIVRTSGTLLIADEVMTGFGRVTDAGGILASHSEGVQPDLVALAKGLTGGYLPMAATLATQSLFDAFLGNHDEFKTFFHGHSYTANQLGAATAMASLNLLNSRQTQKQRRTLASTLHESLQGLWKHPNVGDIRQVGCVAGVELVQDWKTRKPFALQDKAGIRVCEAMARRGVLTRPIGNVIALMPPYCTAPSQVRRMVRALGESLVGVFGT